MNTALTERGLNGWLAPSTVSSAWLPSVADVFVSLRDHLGEEPAISDTLWWIVDLYVIRVHERIAYSKLPEDTFRFRMEDGYLRFFDNGVERFPLAAIRDEPLAFITRDLGLWDRDENDLARLTDRGENFVAEVFG